MSVETPNGLPIETDTIADLDSNVEYFDKTIGDNVKIKWGKLLDNRSVNEISDGTNVVIALPDATKTYAEQIIKRRGSGSGKVTFTTESGQTIEGLVASAWELKNEGIIVLAPLNGNYEVLIFYDYPQDENALQKQLSQAKAWINFDGTGSVAIRDSFNVSSITDNGVGDYTINFKNALNNTNYAVCGNAGNISSATDGILHLYSLSTTSVRIRIINISGVAVDRNLITFVVFAS